MKRTASVLPPTTAPAEVRRRHTPSAIETRPVEVERFLSERDADLRAERMLLAREACIVIATLVCLVILRVLVV